MALRACDLNTTDSLNAPRSVKLCSPRESPVSKDKRRRNSTSKSRYMFAGNRLSMGSPIRSRPHTPVGNTPIRDQTPVGNTPIRDVEEKGNLDEGKRDESKQNEDEQMPRMVTVEAVEG